MSNLTKRSNLIYKNILKSSSRDKDKSIKRSLNLNNRLLSGQKNNSYKRRYDYVKLKHISHDFSNKKNLEHEFSNRINTTNNITNKTKRILSPQISIGLNKRKISKEEKNKNISLNKNSKNKNKNNHVMNLNLDSFNINNKNTINIKDNSYKEKEYVKININQNYKKSKEKNTKLVKKNKACLSRENKKKLFTLMNNPKFNANEYSSISFVNITKTESNINNQTFNYINKSKNKKLNTHKTNNESQNQKTYFNLLKNKKINKDLFLQDKLFTTFNNSKESKEQAKISQNDIFSRVQKTSESCNSKDNEKKNKNVKKLYIKSKILKTENRILSERNIYNHSNKAKNKNKKNKNSKLEKLNKNNNLEYTTIFSNTKKNIKNILCPKSIKKKKKWMIQKKIY